MTLDEAVTRALEDIEGVFTAIQAANGSPIVMPDGKRAMALKPPDLGSIVLKILATQSILLQCVNHLAGSLSSGFVLSDQEANRIADLVSDRLKNGKVEPELDPGLDLQQVQT